MNINVKKGPGPVDTTTEVLIKGKKWIEISVRLKENEDLVSEKIEGGLRYMRRRDEFFYHANIYRIVKKFPNMLLRNTGLSCMLDSHVIGNVERDKLSSFLCPFLSWEMIKNIDFVLDEDIFKLIEQNGPIALGIGRVEEQIHEWLKDDSTARLNKLIKSLMKWFHGKEPQEVKIKEGAPQKIILKQLGPKIIKRMKKIISSILKLARELYDGGSVDTKELLEQAYERYFASLEKKFKQNPESIEIKEVFGLLQSKVEYKKTLGYTSYLSKTITESPDLYQEFETFLNSKFVKKHSMHRRPHELAEFIIAKRLNVSPETIRSFIYR